MSEIVLFTMTFVILGVPHKHPVYAYNIEHAQEIANTFAKAMRGQVTQPPTVTPCPEGFRLGSVFYPPTNDQASYFVK